MEDDDVNFKRDQGAFFIGNILKAWFSSDLPHFSKKTEIIWLLTTTDFQKPYLKPFKVFPDFPESPESFSFTQRLTKIFWSIKVLLHFIQYLLRKFLFIHSFLAWTRAEVSPPGTNRLPQSREKKEKIGLISFTATTSNFVDSLPSFCAASILRSR